MKLHYYSYEEDVDIETYPRIINCTIVSNNEFLITYLDDLREINIRRLKIDEQHYFTVEVE